MIVRLFIQLSLLSLLLSKLIPFYSNSTNPSFISHQHSQIITQYIRRLLTSIFRKMNSSDDEDNQTPLPNPISFFQDFLKKAKTHHLPTKREIDGKTSPSLIDTTPVPSEHQIGLNNRLPAEYKNCSPLCVPSSPPPASSRTGTIPKKPKTLVTSMNSTI